MNTPLSSIEIEPVNPANQTIIWLHGLGASGDDFVSFTTQLSSAITTTTRFIFPHAPFMPVTLNNGYTMRAWFDIHGITGDAKIDVPGIKNAMAAIGQLIEKEKERGIARKNIYLGGFSQGASIALLTGLVSQEEALGGILALSGYLPPHTELSRQLIATPYRPPVFVAHGTLDPIVPYELGLATSQWLTQVGYSVDWHTYPIAHTVCQQEIDDISQWIISRINQK